MLGISFDWAGVLTGEPAQWLLTGILTTAYVTLAASLLASILAVLVLGLRISPARAGRWPAVAIIELFRNTPLIVQLMFWYFAAFGLLPLSWRLWIGNDHAWARLPGGIGLISPEFLAATWGLGLFSAVFIAEEMRAGLLAVPAGQREAALSQGLGPWAILRHVLLPQALRNAFQPVVGQYLNLMKLSSLATAIGLGEITYQVRQIESYNSHALEAFAVGTVLYLIFGLVLAQVLSRFEPARIPQRRSAATPAHAVAFAILEAAKGIDGSQGADRGA
jgi:polar amino acid transport system permease protein